MKRDRNPTEKKIGMAAKFAYANIKDIWIKIQGTQIRTVKAIKLFLIVCRVDLLVVARGSSSVGKDTE